MLYTGIRRGSRILVRGGASGVLTPGGPEPNICSKLSENCMILKKVRGQGGPGPPGPPGYASGNVVENKKEPWRFLSRWSQFYVNPIEDRATFMGLMENLLKSNTRRWVCKLNTDWTLRNLHPESTAVLSWQRVRAKPSGFLSGCRHQLQWNKRAEKNPKWGDQNAHQDKIFWGWITHIVHTHTHTHTVHMCTHTGNCQERRWTFFVFFCPGEGRKSFSCALNYRHDFKLEIFNRQRILSSDGSVSSWEICPSSFETNWRRRKAASVLINSGELCMVITDLCCDVTGEPQSSSCLLQIQEKDTC